MFLGEMGAIEKTGEKLGDLLSNVRERLPDFTFARLFIQEYAAVLTYKYSSTEGQVLEYRHRSTAVPN